MAVSNDTVEVPFNGLVANVPLFCDFKLFVEMDAVVYYGLSRFVATPGSDYTVQLNLSNVPSERYNDFTVTPTPAFITKIAALVAATPAETNIVYVRRAMAYTSDFTETDAFLREKIAIQFDRNIMLMQQQAEIIERSVTWTAGDARFDLPPLMTRKGFVLEFNVDTGAPQAVRGVGEFEASAEAAATTATNAATAALTYRNDALAYRNTTLTYRNLAESWASAAVDVVVASGKI